MKITEVETIVVGTPWRELTFVELTTDDGLRGLGEARMLNKTDTLLACVEEMSRRYVIGSDPFDVQHLAWRFSWEEYGRAGEVTQTALAAIDMACHDLMGKSLGVPVHQLLGGRFRQRTPAYANGWYQGERDPDTIAAMAARVARAIEEYDPAWIEEPVPPHDVCGPVGTAANVHLAVASSNHKILEHSNDFADPWVKDLVRGAPEVDAADGSFALPTAPGLGVALDKEACAAHPRTNAHFNLVRDGWERRDGANVEAVRS
ncbi:enolase C-terminal domain-like protein [Nonomuraea sp. NPDC049421]|uniref:enolase C-terminal domain-like protein n=1 Tax=Nonomuraea sp. NPDC049421 TaxID=3155275 RepID=UPI003436A7FD